MSGKLERQITERDAVTPDWTRLEFGGAGGYVACRLLYGGIIIPLSIWLAVMGIIIALCFGLTVNDAQAQTETKTGAANPTLRQELLNRVQQDQAIRHELIRKGSRPDKALLARMEDIDSENTRRMKEIIKLHGWPVPELVGEDGTEAAFMLVQHADHEFQKQVLPLVRHAYRSRKLSGQNYALLQDRVLVGEGKRQVYGTQAKPIDHWKGHEPVLYPIEDEKNVDKRRAQVGLPPLADYLKTLKNMYFPNDNVTPPYSQNVFHGVALTFVSQRCIPRNKVPHVGEDFIDFSDLITRFRLANTGSEEIFYLAEDVSKRYEPVGFQLFRPGKDHKWASIYSPARGREAIFTGLGFKWRLLPPGAAIEFEPADMSEISGEHATSVFVNTKPTHAGRVELISDVFIPVTCAKR